MSFCQRVTEKSMEFRFSPGVKPPKQVIAEFYRCEQHNTCHFYASEEFLQFMKRVFAQAGIKLVLKELKKGEFPADQAHRVLEVFKAVHEVQGLKWKESESPIAAIESL